MSDIITVRSLEKTYVSAGEKLTVLRNLDLDVAEGSRIVITGESGCGKSTLLNIIGGIDRATSGSVAAGGWDVTSLDEDSLAGYRSVFLGFIFQFHYLLKDFSALENVCMPARIAGIPEREAAERAAVLLEDVGVYARRDHLPSQLSGGERQRVSLARAFAFPSRILLLDEPFQSQDADTRNVLIRSIRALLAEDRRTVVLVSHSLEELRCLCTRIVTLGGSPLSVIGDSLRLEPRHEEVNSGTCPCGGSVHCK